MIQINNDGMRVLYTSTIFIAVDILAVALRFLAKSRTTNRLASDDIWMLLALMDIVAFNVVAITSEL